MKNKPQTWQIITAIILTFLCSLLIAMKLKFDQTGKAFVPETALATGVLFILGAILGSISWYIFRKVDTVPHNKVNKWIIPSLLLFYIITFLASYFSVSLGLFIWFLINGRDLSEFLPNLKYELLAIPVKNLLPWLSLFTIILFYVLWQKSYRREQRLKAENLKYMYNTLKSQVNPHFLFNSLNTLSEIVYEDPQKAEKYIQRLSVIYRYILENEDTDLISLDDELEFVRMYFDLQKERENDKISLVMQIPDHPKFKIVPVSLQLLVENALKHNSRSEDEPLNISIFHENGYIVVSNFVRKKNLLGISLKTGLSSLGERVRMIMGKEIIIRDADNRFVVKIPLVQI